MQFLTVTFTLFAVIDILGSIPILISLKDKMGGHIRSTQATVASGAFMIFFLFLGEPFLKPLGLDVHSFAVAGSIVIFIFGLEMILGLIFLSRIIILKVEVWFRLHFRLLQVQAHSLPLCR